MRKKSSILTIVLIFFFLIPGISQENELKESYKSYQDEKSDSLRITKHLHYLSLLLDQDKGIEAEHEFELIKKEFEKFPIPSITPSINEYEGIFEYRRGSYINSIISFERCLKGLPQNSKEEIQKAGTVHTWVGLSYSMVNDWENAQLNYQKAIGKLEQAGDSSLISLTYMNIAYIFLDGEDWRNATISLNKAVTYINEKTYPEYSVGIYASLSRSSSKVKNLTQAKLYLASADSIIRIKGSPISQTFYYLAEGEYFFYNNEFEQAILADVKALKFARSWGDSAFVANVLENMGTAYMGWKDYPKALDYLKQSEVIAEENNYLPQKTKSLKLIFRLYRETGQFDKAASIAGKLLDMTDTLSLTLNNNRRIIMDAIFDSEKKEKRISALEVEREIQSLRIRQKNTLNYVLIGSGATLLVISLLTYRNYKQKQKLQYQRISELEKEKHLTATEAVLKGEEQERTRLAKDLHDGLGGMMSGIKYSLQTMKQNLVMTPENQRAFERSMDMLDSSIQEMRRVAHNMMPEALVKFGLDTALKDFCNDINQFGVITITYQSIGMENAIIDQTTAITIYRIIQELINNTMKHAGAKTAIVQVSKTNERISITVEDDGKGFDPAVLQQAKGIGWNNIQRRIEYLKGKLDVRSEPGKGTSVHIELNE